VRGDSFNGLLKTLRQRKKRPRLKSAGDYNNRCENGAKPIFGE